MDIAFDRHTSDQGEDQSPGPLDQLIFFLIIPTAFALLFSLVGIRLIAGMSYFSGLIYMLCHMYIAWWVVSAGTWTSKWLLRRWQPQPLMLCLAGFVLALLPSAYLFSQIGDLFSALYPSFAANRVNAFPAVSGLEYTARLIRYSLPALILFTATVFIYRRLTGIRWLSYHTNGPQSSQAEHSPQRQGTQEAGAAVTPTLPATPLAGELTGTDLPPTSEVIAVKAEQHYIQLYTDAGKELLRFKFGDVSELFADCDGSQVHRSWWVNYRHVNRAVRAGRSIELVLDNNLVIPVSLMNKRAVLEALASRERPPNLDGVS